MKKFLNPSYWFDVWPGPPDVRFWRAVIGFAVLSIVIAVIATLLSRRYRTDSLRQRSFAKLMAWGYTVGPVFLVLAFFRFQRAYFLGMRFWYMAWAAAALVWLLFILKYRIFDLPKKLKLRQERARFEQYLPKKQ